MMGPTHFTPDLGRFYARFPTPEEFKAYRLDTREKQARYWKQFENTRRGFYGLAMRRMRSALTDIMDEAQQAARDALRPALVPVAVRSRLAVTDSIYRAGIREIYLRVVPLFYAKVLGSFNGKGAPLALCFKQEDAEPITRQFAADLALQYVDDEAAVLIREPMGYTREVIIQAARTSSRRGLEEGWGMDRIARDMRQESDVAISRARSLRIGRTEVIRASNFASVGAARSTGLTLNKRWIRTFDDRVRDTHAEAGGQIVPLDGMFTVGGFSARYPGDPNLPPQEGILCRCTVAFDPVD